VSRNPDWDALRDAIALVRARTDAEIDLVLPQVLDASDDGTVTVDATFVRELAALVTISRDLSKMVDHGLLDEYWAGSSPLRVPAPDAGTDLR
jgi:hypothetical protein